MTAIILVALKEDHAPTATYVSKLRQVLPAAFPESIFYFQPADMVTQILNFGIPTQINVRTVGYDRNKNLRIAKELRRRMAADSRRRRRASAAGGRRPGILRADRPRPRRQFGLTANDIALNLNTSLSSSEQVSPNFWTDPANGTPYYLAVQTPEWRVNSLNELKNTPGDQIHRQWAEIRVPGLLSNVATLKRDAVATNANQANIQPVYEIYANAEGRDLGSISADINKIVAEYQKQLSPGNRIEVIGQIDSMNAAFRDLAIGILFAAVFVYLLMVVNYQTWGDPFVVILALPATFCGIVTMLYITGTTLSVPSLMGAIMAIGVASANSILLVTFAREQQLAGMRAFDAAISAGPHPYPAGADDRGRDDRRHDSDGDRRRRRRAERRAGARCDRWPAFCYADHVARGAVSVCNAAQRQRRQARAWRVRRGSAMNDVRTPGRTQRAGDERAAGWQRRSAATRAAAALWLSPCWAAPLRRAGDRLLAALRVARPSHVDGGAAPRFRAERTHGAGPRQREHDVGELAGHD